MFVLIFQCQMSVSLKMEDAVKAIFVCQMASVCVCGDEDTEGSGERRNLTS